LTVVLFFKTAEICIKDKDEEHIQLLSDCNQYFTEDSSNNDSFHPPHSVYPHTSKKAETSHIKQLLTADVVVPNADTVTITKNTNQRTVGCSNTGKTLDEASQLIVVITKPNSVPGTHQDMFGTGYWKNTPRKSPSKSVLIKKYQCRVCDLKFACPKYLTEHIKVHTGEKPCKCSFCDKKFWKKNHCFRLHEIGHTGKQSQCPVCSRRFVSLKKHSADNY